MLNTCMYSLRSTNIYVASDGLSVRLADFGLYSLAARAVARVRCGVDASADSPVAAWMAPQVLRGNAFSPYDDVSGSTYRTRVLSPGYIYSTDLVYSPTPLFTPFHSILSLYPHLLLPIGTYNVCSDDSLLTEDVLVIWSYPVTGVQLCDGPLFGDIAIVAVRGVDGERGCGVSGETLLDDA